MKLGIIFSPQPRYALLRNKEEKILYLYVVQTQKFSPAIYFYLGFSRQNNHTISPFSKDLTNINRSINSHINIGFTF